MNDGLEQKIIKTVIESTIEAMAKEGCPFKGVLFAGLMIGKDGNPVLLEHNVRFGDPECQTLMMRLEGDLAKILMAAAKGDLQSIKHEITWSRQTSLCVVMAAKGYPGAYDKGSHIHGIDKANHIDGVQIFHAGTALDEDGQIISIGGRVLGVTAIGDTIKLAAKKAYMAVDIIEWPEGFCRRDIGWRALK